MDVTELRIYSLQNTEKVADDAEENAKVHVACWFILKHKSKLRRLAKNKSIACFTIRPCWCDQVANVRSMLL